MAALNDDLADDPAAASRATTAWLDSLGSEEPDVTRADVLAALDAARDEFAG